MVTRTFIAFLIYYLNFLLARQLSFSIDANGLSLGTLTPFDWGTIEANDLSKPPSDSRNLVLVHKTSISSLFVTVLNHLLTNSNVMNGIAQRTVLTQNAVPMARSFRALGAQCFA